MRAIKLSEMHNQDISEKTPVVVYDKIFKYKSSGNLVPLAQLYANSENNDGTKTKMLYSKVMEIYKNHANQNGNLNSHEDFYNKINNLIGKKFDNV